MFNFNDRTIGNYNTEPGLSYFKNQLGSAEHIYRQGRVNTIHNHLLREHNVKQRLSNTYVFKGKVFTPAAIVLQGIKSVINFHTAYLVGNPVTITGTPKAVEILNRYYRNGIYSKVDWQILNDLITYGNAFEYVYLDENRNIRSKVFRNQDAYPIYDDNMRYSYFVEHWKNKQGGDEHFTIYYPSHVDTYFNNRLIGSKNNYTGLPIHYTVMDKAEYDQFGDSMVLDLIPLMDKIEGLLSKLDDAITNLSLNPVGVITGAKVTEQDMVDSNVSGAVLNLEEGNTFSYASAEMDYQCIKYELDQLYQQFNLVAGIPSSILGQNNIANVSENSMSMVYQLTENKGKQNMNSLIEGFRERWVRMRNLMNLTGNPISDEDFDSLNVSFNISKPIDTKQNMENMKMQYEMGALSKRTIMELSPYTTDSAQELQRLEDEGKSLRLIPDNETNTSEETNG
jgi:SPP1 family phage portal protein